MTDVSSYAHNYDISENVFISPEILADIEDIPNGYEERGEIDRLRLRRIVGALATALRRDNRPREGDMPVRSLLARGSKGEITQVYELVATILPSSNRIELRRPDEVIDTSQAMAERVAELRKDLKPTPPILI
jgi:hypothetical protein